jgi:threonine dehydratase
MEGAMTVLLPFAIAGVVSGLGLLWRGMGGYRTAVALGDTSTSAIESLAAGEVRHWPVERPLRTIADGLRTPLSELTLAHLTKHLDGTLAVTDDELLDTVRVLARQARLVVEPSGAAATAAVLHHRSELPAGRVVTVISGGNIDPELFRRVLAE